MAESTQHKLDRVRRPRVQITYDVETGGAMKAVELPFVVGVLADMSAQRKEALPALKERKFVPIDRDNFNDVLARSAPRLAMKVDNKLTGDANSKLAVELNFKSLSDFEPAARNSPSCSARWRGTTNSSNCWPTCWRTPKRPRRWRNSAA